MQTPDETDHYLRIYAISMGHFDFDAARGYPEDVNELVAAFPGAWVNAHTSPVSARSPDTHAEQAYNTAGYALKQYGQGRPGREHLGQLYAVSQLGKPRFCGRFRNCAHQLFVCRFCPGHWAWRWRGCWDLVRWAACTAGDWPTCLAYAAMCYAALRVRTSASLLFCV